MIWLTSDLHLFHKDFIYKPRGFQSVAEMNAAIEKNWNELVADDDDVYILGDIMVGGKEIGNDMAMEIVNRLKGRKHIILGNHDTAARIALYQQNGIDTQYATMLKYKGHNFYLSHFPSYTVDPVHEDKPKEWIINFFGHTHSKEKFFEGHPFMYNVSLDAHDNRPVSIEEAVVDIKVKISEIITKK